MYFKQIEYKNIPKKLPLSHSKSFNITDMEIVCYVQSGLKSITYF